MKFNIRKIEKAKLQRFMLNSVMCVAMAANISGFEFDVPALFEQATDSIKMNMFGGPEDVFASTVTNTTISVFVGGSPISFEKDITPFIDDGCIMMPLESTFESMGYRVQNNSGVANQTLITISSEDRILESGTISVWDDSTLIQDKWMLKLDAVLKLEDGKHYLSLESLAEITGANVSWDNDNRRVDINFS